MTYTATPEVTAVRPCPACGDTVEVEANFCPTCGTRQIDGTPRPEPAPEVPLVVPEHPVMEHETMAWALLGLGVLALMLVVSGLLAGRLVAAITPGDGSAAGDGDGSAAATMDDYAPLDEAWQDKQASVTDQGAQDDSAGLATAAHDAASWISVNGEALSGVSADARGASAPAYQELVGIYAHRYDVLTRIEAEATAGATGAGAAGDELAEFADLDAQADAALCTIAGVMRAEGDAPADHLPAGAATAC
jgi:hypothetical protein